MKKLLSYALIAGGLVLIFFGARDLIDSWSGQRTAEKQAETAEKQAKKAQKQAEVVIAPDGSPAPARPPQPPKLVAPKLGQSFAKMLIPRLDKTLYVVEGDGARQLRLGPGHMPGTAMPGAEGNCVIAGHRDTHFRILKDIRKGDEIVLETGAGEYRYRVESTRVVSPGNTSALQNTADAELKLVTCYPFYFLGPAPKRFVVEARLDDGGAAADATKPHSGS